MNRNQLWAGTWFGLLVAHLALLFSRGGMEFAGSVLAAAVCFAFLIAAVRDFWRQP